MAGSIEGLKAALAPRYRLQDEVARGGMATVYAAEDTKHGRRVAVKVVRPELGVGSMAERFLREIDLTAKLQHANILPLFDSGRAGDLVYYVMPYVAGETLADRLAHGPLATEEVVRVTRSVASALQYAHDAGVVHRDVKPSNVLFLGGEAVVADFGIALAPTGPPADRLTGTGVAVGTPHYMSPEQARGDEIDGRSDQYGLACMVYHMLTGEPPYPGSSFVGVVARHLTDPVPPLSATRPDVGQGIEDVVTRALSKDAADRFPSVEDFAEALGRAVAGERPRRMRSLTLPAAALAALSLGGLATWLLTADRRPLDPNRIVVYPFVTASAEAASVGEDLATTIGHALDGTASIRWIDGWTLLDDEDKEDPRGLSTSEARALARGRDSAYYVTGRVVARGDSTEVLLSLSDVAGDSVVVGSGARGSSDNAWRVGLTAANGLLPSLIGAVPERFGANLFDRRPDAVANFLLAERLFRRARGTEALAAYRAAFAADSTFALAAIRGARAATWEHQHELAAELIEAAADLPIDPEQRLLGEGVQARLRGHADTAVHFFEAALAADSSFAEAWIQLGETFRHVSPKRSGASERVVSSMQRALEVDPGATNALFHLIEEEIRRGEVDDSPSLQRFLAAEPQENLVRDLLLARDCVTRPDQTNLDERVRLNPAVTAIANAMATGGMQLDCAERLFRAQLGTDTASGAEGRVNASLTGLHGVLVARGRVDEALALLDSARVSTDAFRRAAAGQGVWSGASPAAWDRETRLRARHLVALDEMIGIDVGARSDEVAAEDLVEWGEDLSDAYSDDLWRRAVSDAWRGFPESAARFQAALRDRAADASERVQVLADVVPGHLALARGDSAEALRIFGAARPKAPQATLNWHFGYPLGLERLLEAELLLAAGRPREAMEVAAVLDGPPIIYLQYLRRSLELRIRAAEVLGERRLVDSLRRRLNALDR